MFIIYGTSTCVWCDRAKEFLGERREDYSFRNIENPHYFENYKYDFPGAKTVPQIITPNGDKIGGFDALENLYK